MSWGHTSEEHASEDKEGALYPSLAEGPGRGVWVLSPLHKLESKLVSGLSSAVRRTQRAFHQHITAAGLRRTELGPLPSLPALRSSPGSPQCQSTGNTREEHLMGTSTRTLSNVSLQEDWEDISKTDP